MGWRERGDGGDSLPTKCLDIAYKERVTDAHNSKVWLKQASHRTEPEGGRRESPPGARMQWSKGQRERVGERHPEQEPVRVSGVGGGWREAKGECADTAFLV